MKDDTELKITIIGLGNLMEEVFPCISETVGTENLQKNVNATTADETDWQRKKEHFGINVILNDNLAALKAMAPDIIFFAPPPSVAPKLIETELKDYFDYLRQQDLPKPDIFAFPPVPAGAVYYKYLGEDTNVLRILPSALKSIAGVPISTPALATTEKPWPQDRLERSRRIWSVQSGLMELPPDQLLSVLGGGVMSSVTPEMILDISDMLKEYQPAVSHQDLASYMRARHHESTHFIREESPSCSTDGVSGHLCPLLDGIISSWYAGIVDYIYTIDLPKKLGQMMVTSMLDTMLWFSQAESRKTIERHTEVSATKGGVLEKGVFVYRETISPVIKEALESLPTPPTELWNKNLQNLVYQAANAVLEHGKKLDS